MYKLRCHTALFHKTFPAALKGISLSGTFYCHFSIFTTDSPCFRQKLFDLYYSLKQNIFAQITDGNSLRSKNPQYPVIPSYRHTRLHRLGRSRCSRLKLHCRIGICLAYMNLVHKLFSRHGGIFNGHNQRPASLNTLQCHHTDLTLCFFQFSSPCQISQPGFRALFRHYDYACSP